MNEWQFLAAVINPTSASEGNMEIYVVNEAQLMTLAAGEITAVTGQPKQCAIETQITAPNTATNFFTSKYISLIRPLPEGGPF